MANFPRRHIPTYQQPAQWSIASWQSHCRLSHSHNLTRRIRLSNPGTHNPRAKQNNCTKCNSSADRILSNRTHYWARKRSSHRPQLQNGSHALPPCMDQSATISQAISFPEWAGEFLIWILAPFPLCFYCYWCLVGAIYEPNSTDSTATGIRYEILGMWTSFPLLTSEFLEYWRTFIW